MEESDQEVKIACSTILLKLAANGLQYVFEKWWSVVRGASLAKGGTSKKRPSPHFHKVSTRNNKVSPRNFQTTIVHKPSDMLISVTTDGSPNLTGEKLVLLKMVQCSFRETYPNREMLLFHCIIHHSKSAKLI
jgi:hypothetical protein